MLRDIPFDEEYRTGEKDPLAQFFLPALKQATLYWLAAGYFSSRLFDVLGSALGDFVRRGGRMRLVTSVYLSQADRDAIERGLRLREELIAQHLQSVIEQEFRAPLAPGVQLVASMLKTGLLEIKLATRVNGNLYHEKLGVIFDDQNDMVAFSGSANATQEALLENFESIDVYTSTRDASRAEKKRQYFERLWERHVPEVALYDLPDGLSRVIIREHDKTVASIPPQVSHLDTAAAQASSSDPRYLYQQEAVDWFVDPNRAGGSGILWMATGTGKTVTALKIARHLFERQLIDAVVINASERLLIQWDAEMKKNLPGQPDQKAAPWRSFTKWQTSGRKESNEFRQLARVGKCLLITYSFLPEFVSAANRGQVDLSRTLLIIDEAHNIGADENISRMQMSAEDLAKFSESELRITLPTSDISQATHYAHFGLRLGLSATPFSDYDDQRNQFIVNALLRNPVQIAQLPQWSTLSIERKRTTLHAALVQHGGAFYYGLEDGIRDEVLVPFDYIPVAYEPTSQEKAERIRVMRLWQTKVKNGEASPAAPYIHMAKVFKASLAKIDAFRDYMRSLREDEQTRLMRRALVFVETRDFGLKVADVLHEYGLRYHTFFSGDEERNLHQFSNGALDILVTCHMISEGIDIRSVSSIILFASDRQRLESVQRIGRALRRNPADPGKTAVVLDFVYCPANLPDSADADRMQWLEGLSKVRPHVENTR